MTQPRCDVAFLGMVDYARALELQRGLAGQRRALQIDDQLLLLEHPAVVTLGLRGGEQDLLVSQGCLRSQGIDLHHVDRGGQATYHGPGQLVGYPIVDLRQWGSPLEYVRTLEEVLLRTAAAYGVVAHRVPGHPGAWAGDAKLAAIGVRVSGGVTSHGFALNVHTDLRPFSFIVPCGTPGMAVTSLERLAGSTFSLDEVAQRVAREFGVLFQREVCWLPAEARQAPSLAAPSLHGP